MMNSHQSLSLKSFIRSLSLAAFVAVAFCPAVRAQTPTPAPAASPGKNLTVVTRKVTPFVMEKNGRLTGYSIELWERVVREARLPFDPDSGYKIVDNVQQMLDALRNGQADVGVAAVSITAEREKTVDFSYPFKESGLQILTRETPGSSFGKIVGSLVKGQILWLLAGLFGGAAFEFASHLVFRAAEKSGIFPGRICRGRLGGGLVVGLHADYRRVRKQDAAWAWWDG